jgi:hypothetical protein
MNNKNLINFINLYGGNDNPSDYTNSLLTKYKTNNEPNNETNNESNIIKINNLEIMLYDTETDTENSFLEDLLKLEMKGGSNNIIKINNLEKILYDTNTESDNILKLVMKGGTSRLMKKSKKKYIRILSDMII